MRLSEYAKSRDNNFLALRLMAAFIVLIHHSGPILGAPSLGDFMGDHVGRSMGEMALDMLFVVSGFLVTASLFNRGDLNHFLWARALRLFPALLLMMPLCVFVLAPALTTLPLSEYYSSNETWTYFWRGITVLWGMRYHLPGVFDSAPLRGEVNGSLWTLPVEARMYIYLAIGWLAFTFAPRWRVRGLSVLAPIIAAALFVPVWRAHAHGTTGNGDIAVFMFFYGASLYFWRSRIVMNRWTFAALPALVIAAALIGGPVAAFTAYLFALPPFLLHLAYLPGGPIRRVNAWGDYSYGIYIYAFPVQQTLAHLFPGMSLATMIVAAGALSWAFAYASWHLLEKRAMTMKDACAEATARGWRALQARVRRDRGLAAPEPATLDERSPDRSPA